MYKIDNIINNNKESFIWLMRQAGRYLPEYRQTRKEAGSFLDLCYNPELASKVTIQPIDRFGFDAAIIFSDILVILDALGAEVTFTENIGPEIKVDINEFVKLDDKTIEELITEKLEPVYQAIRLTRANLDQDKSLIGFSGAFWTLLAYLIEGRGSKTYHNAKIFTYNNPTEFKRVKNILCKAIAIHLRNQVVAGCDIIKIFDSWAGILTPDQMKELVIEPYKIILAELKDVDAKKICFPRGIGSLYSEFCKLDFDIFALDYTADINIANKIANEYGKVTQGNLDPAILFANQEILGKELDKILEATKDIPHIFNLGHGIMPKTPIENVEFMVEKLRGA